MLLISHRGNIDGKNPDRENHPKYILKALDAGYNVEVDIWYTDHGWLLGHDEPKYPAPDTFFKDVCLLETWFHAKNGEAFQRLLNIPIIHCFFHDKDEYALTSHGYVWVYPGAVLLKNSICVLPEQKYNGNLKECAGICSDYPENYKIQ